MAEEKNAKLKELEDEAWETIKVRNPITCARKEHEFIRKSGTEIECIKCPMGFPASVGTEVKDGHIYIHGQFIL